MALSYLWKKKSIKYKKTIVLAGTGRSGTTWLAELINFRKDYRLLFEPFHNEKVQEWSSFHYRQYLKGDENDQRIRNAMDAILTGKIANKWVDRSKPNQSVSRLLIKDIRANLLLKWISTHYPAIPIILLIRHPGAVAISRIRLGWETHLDEFTGQEALLNDFLMPYKTFLENPDLSIIEKNTALWCVETMIPLLQFNFGEIFVMFYENLILQPRIILEKLFRFLGETFDDKILDGLQTPSFMARESTGRIRRGDRLLDIWHESINPEEVEQINQVMKLFGLYEIFNDRGLPDEEALVRFMTPGDSPKNQKVK